MKYLIATLLYVTSVPILAKRYIQFNEEPSDLVTVRNKVAELQCNITAKGKLVISWLKDGVKLNLTNDTRRTILPHGSLYFNPILRKRKYSPDTGEYRCLGETIVNGQTFKIQSRKARLTVATMSKSFATLPQNVTLNEGETAFFECKIRRSHPKAKVTWKKVGKNTDLALNFRFVVFPSGILEILSVMASDAGTYECVATNEALNKHQKASAELNINAASAMPKPSNYLVKPKNVVTLHNKHVILECIVTGYPKPQVEWHKDGESITLTQSGHYSKYGASSLKVSSAQAADGGKYECVMGTEKAEANLQVIVPPQFKVSPTDVETDVNKDVTMQCEVTGNPKPKITWYKNGNVEEVQVEHIEVTDTEITIMEVLESDGGIYQCFAENEGGEIMASAQLKIYGTQTTTSPPVILAPSKPRNVKATAENSTTIRVFWEAPDRPHGKIKEYTVIIQQQSDSGYMVLVPIMPTTQETQLIVSNLQPATLYQFSVYASNEHKKGQLSNPIQELTLKRKPSTLGPPRDVQVVALSSMALKVSWKPPLNNLQVIKNYSINYRVDDGNMAWRTESSLRHNVVLLKLLPYTSYAVKVTAYTVLGPGQTSSEVIGKTKSGKPNGPPENVVLVAYKNVLVARWSPPSYPNGNITGYLMTLKNENTGSISNDTSKDSDYIYMNVERSVTYSFRVAAVTEAGRGEFSQWVRKDTPSPDITEDVVPGKPSNLRTRVVLGMVQITWDPPKESHIVVRGYVLSYGKLTPDDSSTNLPNTTTKYLLSNLQPETIYIIRVRAKNKKGQGLEALETVTVPRMKQSGIYNLQAIPFKKRAMRLSWIDPTKKMRPYVGYTVRFEKDHKMEQLNVTKGTSLVVKNLRPGMEYIFHVKKNDEPNFVTVSNSTMEEVPSAPNDITVSLTSEISTVKVHWNTPVEPNGKLTSYKICWRRVDGIRNYNWTCKVVKSYVLNDQISNVDLRFKYSVKILAKNRAGEGVFSKPKEFDKDSILGIRMFPPSIKGPSSNGTNSTKIIDHPDKIYNKNFTKPTGAPTDEDGKKLPGGTTEGLSDEEKTLWIVIAVIAAVTLVAIVIISIVLCKKRASCGTPTMRRKPPADPYKAVANGNSQKKPTKKNFWIKQDNMELEPCVKKNDDSVVESTIPRSADEMKPLDSPFQSRKDRNSLEDDEDDPVGQGERGEPPPYRHREDYQPLPVLPVTKQNNIHIQKSPFTPQDPDEFPPPPEGLDGNPDEGPSSDYGSEELVSPKCDTDEPTSVMFIPKNSPNGCVSVAPDYNYPAKKGVHDIDANNLQNLMKDLDAIMAKEDRV